MSETKEAPPLGATYWLAEAIDKHGNNVDNLNEEPYPSLHRAMWYAEAAPALCEGVREVWISQWQKGEHESTNTGRVVKYNIEEDMWEIE